ncbi:MAG: diacylglycerol/lipid kinase family protein [Candidatus Sumerlaeaceae bacterium]
MRLLFLINRRRRNQPPDPRLLDQMKALIRRAGVEHRLELCDSPEHSEQIAREAIEHGFDTIWLGGGDGSVYHLINQLRDAQVTYGVVPMGTMNALARSLKVPRDPIEAVQWLLNATARPMDLGEVQGRRFAVFASVGYHAAIMHGINPELKRRHGKLAFFESGIRVTARLRELPEFQLEFEPRYFSPPDQARESYVCTLGHSLVVSNVHNYAGFGIIREQPNFPVLLDLQLFRNASVLSMARWFWNVRYGAGWRADVAGVEHFGAAECVLKSERPLSVQLDGEPVALENPCELSFRCLPGIVQFLQTS